MTDSGLSLSSYTVSPGSMQPRDRLILALDFPSAAASLAFLAGLTRSVAEPPLWVKVGLELFLAEGAAFVHTLRNQGYSVFLDLKLHDIPNTVASAIRALSSLNVQLLTVHGAGGPAMLAAAAEAAASLPNSPQLLAVTVLTSMDQTQLAAVGVPGELREQALRLAKIAWQTGVHGLVASPLEAALLRGELGAELQLVTPGIRLESTPGGDDQKRTATPAAALRAGASRIVVGRPVTRAADPAAAYRAILSEIQSTLSESQNEKPGSDAGLLTCT